MGNRLTVHLFRREFDLPEIPASCRIAVTADSRYVLWLNGERIGRGPLKGTLDHYHAETYDLAPKLQPGKNVLAAEVRWFGSDAPASEVHGSRGGLWIQALDDIDLDTPGEWLVTADSSIVPNDDDPFQDARGFLGPTDKILAALRPTDWNQMEINPAAWTQAVPIGPVPAPDGWGTVPPYRLAPRDIPALTESPSPFAAVLLNRRPTTLPWILEADTQGEIWLDAGSLTTSYPELRFDGGSDREVHITYAEALGHWETTEDQKRWIKEGPRNDISKLEPHGYSDVVVLPGGTYEFEPFHWRTFRFVKITILPGAEPVRLESASHRFTTYDQDFSASFDCDAKDFDRLWDNSLRTLRLCAHETYEDCPYFEQLSYIGDARLQALCSYFLGNHTLLARRSLRLFKDSLGPAGLTASRAPSRSRQVIPAFSLHWILMLADYWQWRGPDDVEFVRSNLHAVDFVLGYFRDRILENGFVGPIDDWAWTDWVPDWKHGVSPVAAARTGSTYLTALFAHTLDTAITLHQQAGRPEDADRWKPLLTDLRKTVGQSAWSSQDGLFVEGPNRDNDPFTQHSQVMAILAGAAGQDQIEALRNRLLNDPALVRMSLFQRFYLARALETTNDYHRFFSDVLRPWYAMIENGLSTWQEKSDPTRSDCHAWSSWMVIDFFHSFLGARPSKPGWREVTLKPQFFATTRASGQFSTPVGDISVAWMRDRSKQVTFSANLPADIPANVIFPNGQVWHFRSGGEIRLTADLSESAPRSNPAKTLLS